MPDEATQAPAEQDQPTTDGAPQETGTSAAEEDRFTEVNLDETPEGEITQEFLRQRLDQMQGDYTRKTQSLAEQRRAFEAAGLNDEWFKAYNDPETRDEAVKWFLEREGIALEDDEAAEAGGEEGSDDEFRDPRVDDLLAEREREQAEALVSDIKDHLGKLAKEAEVDLPERWLRALTRDALEAGATPSKTESLFEEWANDLKGYGDKAVDAYRNSKTDAPSPPPRGSGSGSPEVDINDESARRRRMQQVADEVYGST